MKSMKKLLTFALVLVMLTALSATVFAAGTGTITITPPAGTQAETTNTYKIYKVFDADGDGTGADGAISYKLVSGKTSAPAGFTVDAAGNVSYTGTSTTGELTAADIAAIAAYVTEDDLVATVTSTGTTAATAANLPNGYYYIKTSTGSVVTINSTNPNVSVNDKNEVPPVTKKIGSVGIGALDAAGKAAVAQVGTTVGFEATVTVKKGQHNYVFHDTMSAGLELVAGSVTVTGVDASNYTIKPSPDSGDTITISFEDGIAENTVITIKYNATVTSDALTIDYANNTASVSYGDNNSSTSKPQTKIYTGSIEALKMDGNNTETEDDDSPLKDAGFVLKNSDGKYYKLDGVVTWVDSIDEADEHKSGTDGKIAPFTGLGSGKYTLEEKTVPSGFNKADDVTNIEVPAPTVDASGNVTNADALKVDAGTILNNKGTVLPSTGGIGTTLFYVFGGILFLGAAVVLVTRRRVRE